MYLTCYLGMTTMTGLTAHYVLVPVINKSEKLAFRVADKLIDIITFCADIYQFHKCYTEA